MSGIEKRVHLLPHFLKYFSSTAIKFNRYYACSPQNILLSVLYGTLIIAAMATMLVGILTRGEHVTLFQVKLVSRCATTLGSLNRMN